jgi:hypothetical protein
MKTTHHTVKNEIGNTMRRARTLIAMGTVGLALVVAVPASAEDSQPVTTTNVMKTKHDTVKNSISNVRNTTTTTTTTQIDGGPIDRPLHPAGGFRP